MQERVRAIIRDDEKILTIKRVKENETYWVLPGGGVDDGEDNETALIRECKEELGVEVKVQEKIFEYEYVHEQYGKQKEFFYRCVIVGGKLGSGEGPEYQEDSKYEGSFELEWVEISELRNFDVRPIGIVNVIKKYFVI